MFLVAYEFGLPVQKVEQMSPGEFAYHLAFINEYQKRSSRADALMLKRGRSKTKGRSRNLIPGENAFTTKRSETSSTPKAKHDFSDT